MMKKTLFSALIASLMASTAHADVVGYLYTTLNGETTNQIISFERHDDGTLGEQAAYSTGSLGGANRAAGGDAATCRRHRPPCRGSLLRPGQRRCGRGAVPLHSEQRSPRWTERHHRL